MYVHIGTFYEILIIVDLCLQVTKNILYEKVVSL